MKIKLNKILFIIFFFSLFFLIVLLFQEKQKNNLISSKLSKLKQVQVTPSGNKINSVEEYISIQKEDDRRNQLCIDDQKENISNSIEKVYNNQFAIKIIKEGCIQVLDAMLIDFKGIGKKNLVLHLAPADCVS